MVSKALRLSCLVGALLCAQFAQAQGRTPTYEPRRADVVGDAMNFIPSTPSYEQMRDGMLQTVATGPAPGDKCTVWAAFAQFGIGVGASGVVNADGTVTITESFTKGDGC